MTDTRFLSPELRKRYAENMLDMIEIMELANFALHDLDVADAEIARLQSYLDNELCDIRLDGEAKDVEIHRLQKKCEKIPCYLAEAETHRTMLKERDAMIAAMREQLDFLLQAFDPEHPAACKQECFDSSDGHGYEMQDAALNSAREVLGKTARLATDYDQALRANERQRVLDEVRHRWLGMSSDDWARWLQENWQLATPKEVI